MAAIKDVIDGLRILAKYNAAGEMAHIGGAEHDIIYGPTTDHEDVDITDQAELFDLGWHWSIEYSCWCRFV